MIAFKVFRLWLNVEFAITTAIFVQRLVGVDRLADPKTPLFVWLRTQRFLALLHYTVCNWTGQLSEEWTSRDLEAVIMRCLVQIPCGAGQSGPKWELLSDLPPLLLKTMVKGWNYHCGIKEPPPPPPRKRIDFLSVVVTTLCTSFCLQKVTNNRTDSHVLCNPEQEGHTVVVLEDHWRLFDTKQAEVWCDDNSQPPVSLCGQILNIFPITLLYSAATHTPTYKNCQWLLENAAVYQ